jgi:hypothetical protein
MKNSIAMNYTPWLFARIKERRHTLFVESEHEKAEKAKKATRDLNLENQCAGRGFKSKNSFETGP